MHLSQQDLFTGIIAMTIIGCAIFCVELLLKNKLPAKFQKRKLLHLIAITTCAWCMHNFQDRLLLGYIFLSCSFILLWVIQKGWMQAAEYNTYGIALFPLAFAVLLFIPAFSVGSIVYAAMILGISDAAAGLTGEYFGKQKIIFLSEKKSWVGFVAFYVSAILISVCYYSFSPQHILLCLILALLPALTELFSYKGSDNFTVPIFSAIWMELLHPFERPGFLQLHLFILFFILVCIAFAIAAVYKKWLSVSGAVAACWVALLLLITGGLMSFIVPGIFLVSGSLLSKLNKPAKEKEGRNALQVFANGIIGVLCMIFYSLLHEKIYLIAGLVSFCISMSDSCSSEIGYYFKGRTYDILSFKKMQPGLSGGISLQGTMAGAAGAAVIAGAALLIYHLSIDLFLLVLAAGFTGMLADSVLGSWLQVKYKSPDRVISDDPGPNAIRVRGFTWCTNDSINILSNIITTLAFLLVLKQITKIPFG